MKFLTFDSLERLIHSKIEERLSDSVGIRDALKLFGLSPESTVDILTFKRVLERFGVVLRDDELRQFFHRYDADDSGRIVLSQLLPKDYPSAPWYLQTDRVDGGNRDTTLRARRQTFRRSHSDVASEVSKQYTENDMELLLRDKIMERGRSSKEPIKHAFRLFGRPRDGIDFPLFRETLLKFGVPLNEQQMRALFTRYDKDKSGVIHFYEFARGVMPDDYPKNSVLRQLSDQGEGTLDVGSHEAKMESVRLSANSSMERLSSTWQWSHDSIREIIQRKILERGGSSKDLLRQAFFLFGRPVNGITVDVFKSTLKGFGIPASDAELDEMFNRFDDDKSGRINFYEFARNVMPQDYIGESLYRGFQAAGEENGRKARSKRLNCSASSPNVRLVATQRRFPVNTQPATATSLTLATRGAYQCEDERSSLPSVRDHKRLSRRGSRRSTPRLSLSSKTAISVPRLALSTPRRQANALPSCGTRRSGQSSMSNNSSYHRELLAKFAAQDRAPSSRSGRALHRLKREKKWD